MRFWVFLWASSACAQVTVSSVSGLILNPRLEPVPKAEVTLSRPDRGFSKTLRTDDNGFYFFADLPPAHYTLAVKADPFNPASAEIALEVNTRLRADFRLSLPSLNTRIEVAATVQLIPTDSSDLGSVFD